METHRTFLSKKISLLILAITSLVCSRTTFVFIDDPEGPNLLIVVVLAAVLYGLSFSVSQLAFQSTELKKLILAIFTQILVVTGLLLLIGQGVI